MTLPNLPNLPELPITEVIDALRSALLENCNLVLVAPPGAGKTTLVPLALLDAPWRNGRKIIVLEPRRLAARAAATRMASLLLEQVGGTVGYRIRFDARVGKDTQIEVVTGGVFTRMLADDPGLENVAAVLFDEFHERSLEGDLSLALCLDVQSALREDLRLLPMSATLDGAAIAELMGARVLESKGRSYPVEVIYRERPPDVRIENAVAEQVMNELQHGPDGAAVGGILVFLPGQREIERTAELLESRLSADLPVHRLYGALPQRLQDLAIEKPGPGQRKLVLASAIAETSLTIEGITTVIDSGLARQPVFEPATGLTRLQTVRASQDSITQRTGRAGRLGPGRSIRLWRAEQTAALPSHAPPEILNADLSAMLLNLAEWGVSDSAQLNWLDPPPLPALQEAQTLLQELKAVSADGKITTHGRAIAGLALPPRYAHMVLSAAEHSRQWAYHAAIMSLLLQERGVGGPHVDLEERLQNALRSKGGRAANVLKLAQSIARRAVSFVGLPDDVADSGPALSCGMVLAFGFPDRVAQRTSTTSGGTVRFRLANGRGAELDATESLSNSGFIVVIDMAGRAGAARILSAAAIEKAQLLEQFGDRIEVTHQSELNLNSGQIESHESKKLGALVLAKPKPVKLPPLEIEAALLAGIAKHGTGILPWRDEDQQLRNRLALLHQEDADNWPDVSDAALLECLDQWLTPFMSEHAALAKLNRGQLSDGLLLLAGHPSKGVLDALVPTHFDAPSGTRIRLEYEAERVRLAVRPQELFGMDQHPTILDGQVSVEVELLSPAGRPIQITRDLPGFWRGSWRDVRADLRGRYPKHPWPEDPLNAAPTRRVKPRKS